MICPAPRPVQPSAANPNWLDRLRSSRGFPPVDALDLGCFLAAQTSASSSDVPPRPRAVPQSRGDQGGEKVADILCELFVMGGGRGGVTDCEGFRGKSLRKQRNPKFWGGAGSSKKGSNGCSSDDLKREKRNRSVDINGLASSGDNSLNRKEQDQKSAEELRIGVEEDEEVDLRKYSKSEVTVIDSSIQGWKSEMFVFRKGKNVWRVREKKNKSRSSMSVRKKRKLMKSNSSDKDDDEDDEKRGKKKNKILRVLDSAHCSLSRNGKGDRHAELPLLNEGQLNHGKAERALDRDALLRGNGEAPIKSLPCSSSHWKLKSGTSSVILVGPISTFDKSGTRKPGKISIDRGQNPL